MLSSMAGSAVFSGGKWLIRAGAFESPTVQLTEADARGPIKIQGRRSIRDLFNAVRGTFISPENEYQAADFPIITNSAFEIQDGNQRIVQDIELPFTTSSSTAHTTRLVQKPSASTSTAVFLRERSRTKPKRKANRSSKSLTSWRSLKAKTTKPWSRRSWTNRRGWKSKVLR